MILVPSCDWPPFCTKCEAEMWIISVSTILTDKDIDGTYVCECKHSGRSIKLHRPLAREGLLP